MLLTLELVGAASAILGSLLCAELANRIDPQRESGLQAVACATAVTLVFVGSVLGLAAILSSMLVLHQPPS